MLVKVTVCRTILVLFIQYTDFACVACSANFLSCMDVNDVLIIFLQNQVLSIYKKNRQDSEFVL